MKHKIRIEYSQFRNDVIQCVAVEDIYCNINNGITRTKVEKEIAKYKFEYVGMRTVDNSVEALEEEKTCLYNALITTFDAVKERDPYLKNLSISEVQLCNQDTNEIVVVKIETNPDTGIITDSLGNIVIPF